MTGRFPMLRSLQNRNFRMYLIGQGTSQAGMWFQVVAEVWLILELTDSGTALGVHSILRFAPILVFGSFAGLLGDRLDRRKLLLVTQGLHTVAMGSMAVVVWMTTPTLPLILSIVAMQGLVNAVDNPVRRTFIRDLTSDEELSNAVSLHSSVATTTRAIGPVIAGFLIEAFGVEWCFTLNAVSYLAVLASLLLIDRGRLRPQAPAAKGRGQLRAGWRYSWSRRPIRNTLMLSAVMAMFAWQWNVILPVYARDDFGGDARLFGFLVFVMSVGSLLGALYSARLTRMGGRHLRISGLALSIALALAGVAPVLAVAFVAVFALGAATAAFNIGAQSRLQLAVDDEMTTRVMSMYSVGFSGSKPIGGIILGVLIDVYGARGALIGGAIMTGLATGLYALSRRTRRRSPDVERDPVRS